MNFLIILSMLAVLLISVDCLLPYKTRKRLTERENEIRFSSCGDPKGSYWMVYIMYYKEMRDFRHLKKQINQKEDEEYDDLYATIPNASTPGTTVIPTGTTWSPTEELQELRERAKDWIFATGVFLSYNHVLTSSSFFIERKGSKWFDKKNREIIANCTKRTHFRWRNNQFRVTDGTRLKRSSDSIIFLNFCSLQHTANDFLTIVLLKKKEFFPPRQVICLPKSLGLDTKYRSIIDSGHIVPKKGLKVQFASFSNEEPIASPGNAINTAGLRATSIRDCETANSSGIICTSGVSCTHHNGAPLIKKAETEYQVDMVIGIAITESCNPNSIESFHDVKAAMPTLCRHFGICNRKITNVPLDQIKNEEILTIEDDYVYQEPEPAILNLLKANGRSLLLISVVIVLIMNF